MAASTQTPFLETYLRALSNSSTQNLSISSTNQTPCLSPGSGCTSLQQLPTVFAGHTTVAHNSFSEIGRQQSDMQKHPRQQSIFSHSAVVHQQSDVVSQQLHTMGASASPSRSLYSTAPPTNCLARTSTGFYVSPFAKASACSRILGLNTERKAGSSSLTQALQQTGPERQVMPVEGVQLAAGPNAPGLSQQRLLPSVHSMLEHGRPSQAMPISSAAAPSHGVQQWHHQRSAAFHTDCVQGGSPCSSVTSTADFWNPAVASAPAGLQRSSLMSLSAGSGNSLAAMAGCRSSSGGRLSPLPEQALMSSFGLHADSAAHPQQLLRAMQGATPPARCSAIGCHVVPCDCITAHTVGSAPVRGASMVRSSLSALQLQHLAAVGGVQKSLHSQGSMASVQQQGGATRDTLNKIADALRESAGAADSRASFSEAGNPTGRCTPEERAQKIARYKAKRDRRNFNRSVKYQCRKTLADSRPRIKGRFARDGEPGSVLPDETKKTQKDQQKQQAARAQEQQEGQQQGMPSATAGAAQPAAAAYSLPASNGLTLQEAYYLATRGGNSSSSSASWQQRMQRPYEQQLQQKVGPAPTEPNAAGNNNLQPFQSLRSSMQHVTPLEAPSAAAAAAAWTVPVPAAAAAAADHINRVADQSLPHSIASGAIMHARSASAEATAGDDDAADDFALLGAMLLLD